MTKEDIDSEATAVEKLRTQVPHRNVVQVFRHGWIKSLARGNVPLPVYFVDMELGDQTLQNYISLLFSSPRGGISPGDIWAIMVQISAGVEYLHRRSMVHRDIKPANSTLPSTASTDLVILTTGWTWKVTDFGISTTGTSKVLIATKDGRGTAHYCAPEILFSEPSVPSYTNKVDIWGLGTILYELCTGKRAFQSGYHVMQYYWNEDCPQVTNQQFFSAYDRPQTDDRHATMLGVAKSLFPGISELLPAFLAPSVGVGKDNYLTALNKQLAWLLCKEPNSRPSIDEVNLVTGTSLIRVYLDNSRVVLPHILIIRYLMNE
jgi:serine/threonine protein kinase